MALRHTGHVVHRKHRITREQLKQALLDHQPGTAGVLLGGLEDQVQRARELAVQGQVPGGGQQHGGVAIVATGMHHAVVHAGPGGGAGLVDRQRVHVGAKAQALGSGAVRTAPQRGHHAGAGQAAVHGVAPGLQAVGDPLGGAGFLQAQFGMAVQVAPQVDEFGVGAAREAAAAGGAGGGGRARRHPCCGAAPGGVTGGVTPYLTLTALGQAFPWFRQRYQQVEVELIEGLMSRVLPRLRDGTLDIAAVAADVGEIGDDGFNSQRILQAPQCLVVRAGHPVLADPNARALCALEWGLTQPLLAGQQPRCDAMFAQAGVAPPTRVIRCESLAAMTLLRNSDAVSLFPRPLLGHPETRSLVAIDNAPLRPCDIELLLLTQADVPLTPAAAYFLHRLRSVSQGAAAAGPARVGVGARRRTADRAG